MAASPTTVRTVAPSLESLTDDQIQPAIDQATLRANATFFGLLYDTAVAYLAAHILTIGRAGDTAGPVSAKSAGGLSISYQGLPWSATWYNATAYGREYRALIKAAYPGPAVT